MVNIPPPARSASVQIGDYVVKAGIYTKPGVVTEKKEDGTVVVDTNTESIKEYHRHTNTSGLSVQDKERFNGIMDEIMENENNADRINNLQETIDQLKTDPSNKKIVGTLRNEQAELIRLSRELPRIYSFNANLKGL